MAKATSTHVAPTYSLELNHDEAQTLRDILDNVGGSPENTRRKYADNILHAMHSVGLRASAKEDIAPNSSIYFTE